MESKITVFKTDGFDAYITMEDGFVFFHCDVFTKASKKLLRDVREVCIEMCAYLETLGYERVYTLTPNVKFCNAIFSGISTSLGEANGHTLLVWEFDEVLEHG